MYCIYCNSVCKTQIKIKLWSYWIIFPCRSHRCRETQIKSILNSLAPGNSEPRHIFEPIMRGKKVLRIHGGRTQVWGCVLKDQSAKTRRSNKGPPTDKVETRVRGARLESYWFNFHPEHMVWDKFIEHLHLLSVKLSGFEPKNVQGSQINNYPLLELLLCYGATPLEVL